MFPRCAPGSALKGAQTVRSGAIRGGAQKQYCYEVISEVAPLFPAYVSSAGQGSTVAPQGNMLLPGTAEPVSCLFAKK